MAVDIAIGVAHMISDMLIYIGGCFHHFLRTMYSFFMFAQVQNESFYFKKCIQTCLCQLFLVTFSFLLIG